MISECPCKMLGLVLWLLIVASPISAPSGFATATPSGRSLPNALDENPTLRLGDLKRHIREREYWATSTERGLQAPNRKHGLRTFFDGRGIRVEDRSGNDEGALLSMRLKAWGRGLWASQVEAGVVSSEGARVEILREGLIEWYTNDPSGLEQGFTILESPPGIGTIEIRLALAGARAVLHDDEVRLTSDAGRQFSYGHLAAFDVDGRSIPISLSTFSPNGIRISVDDAKARYPILIDPLLTSTTEAQLESDQAVAQLGISVSDAGDVNGDGYADVIVGAQLFDAGEIDEGAAFLFHGSANGLADSGGSLAATLLESNQTGSAFGWSVSGAGDVNGDGYADIVVGAPTYDASEVDEGAAFVFHGSPVGVLSAGPASAHAQLEANQVSAEFGYAVSGAGDANGDGYADLLVGSRLFDSGQIDEGSAFVFHGSAGGIGAGNPITAAAHLESDQAGAQMGFSVASAGDVNGDGFDDALIGAQLHDIGQVDEGAAFVFHGSAAGIADGNPGTANSVLEANQTNARAGWSVAGPGDVNGDGYADILVGAPRYDSGESEEGAAFVFLGSAAGVASGDPISASAVLESNQADAQFGRSVGIAGDVNGDGYSDVVVGARLYDSGESDEGAAFVFIGSASGILGGDPTAAWVQLEVDQPGASFGWSVSGGGDVDGDGFADVLVGAPLFDAGQSDEGAAFVFRGQAKGIRDGTPATADSRIASDQVFGSLGLSVSSAGDVNGDGFGDIIVGAPEYDSGFGPRGAAFIFHGSASGLADSTPLEAASEIMADSPAGIVIDELGLSVSGAGDVNGDGFADVIIGAPGSVVAGENAAGSALVYHGSSSGIPSGGPATADAQITGLRFAVRFGTSVSDAGDVNGDGYGDVIIGSPGSSYLFHNRVGVAFVYHGSATGIASGSLLDADSDLSLSGFNFGSETGESVSGAGDFNGDGYADVLVGSPGISNGSGHKVQLFLGSETGVSEIPATLFDAFIGDSRLGESVSDAGDVNGDGFGDIIVGAPRYSNGETSEGAAFIFHGRAEAFPNGNPLNADTIIESNQAFAQLGSSVSGAGDVNGDGYSDLIVGSEIFNSSDGAAFVFHGSASGVPNGNPATADAQILSTQADALLGASVSDAGDLNGDGYADVLIGAPMYDAGEDREGAAFLFLGNSEGRRSAPQSRDDDGSGRAIHPWGIAQSLEDFEVAMHASHPAGHGLVKLEVETCPQAVAFGDPVCVRHSAASWTPTGPGGEVLLVESVPALLTTFKEIHRWRARILRAPASSDSPGIAPPLNPAHGPWRRPTAQSDEADLRIVPEPGLGVGLLFGGLFVHRLALAQRRRFSPLAL